MSNVLSLSALLVSAFALYQSWRQWKLTDLRSRMPVLAFSSDGKEWVLENIGNGPALDVVIAKRRLDGSGEWEAAYRIPPIAKEGKYVVTWLGENAETLGATYRDISNVGNEKKGHAYFTKCEDFVSSIEIGNKFPKELMESARPIWEREN